MGCTINYGRILLPELVRFGRKSMTTASVSAAFDRVEAGSLVRQEGVIHVAVPARRGMDVVFT